MMKHLSHVGVIGLGVMGAGFARNLEHAGFRVSVYNRNPEHLRAFMEKYAKGHNFCAAETLREFVKTLESPVKLLLFVPAGDPVDELARTLLPILPENAVIADCGNSYYKDTERRQHLYAEHGLHWAGIGVSGGEEGALHGPSIMAGGDSFSAAELSGILRNIAACVPDGEPCCAWIGPGGSGHCVKMVHNGIEYADMQLFAEAYDLLRKPGGMNAREIGALFADWNQGTLQSYLLETAARILSVQDPETGKMAVDLVADRASEKGTGRWTAMEAVETGVPAFSLVSALMARFVSGLTDERAAGTGLTDSADTVGLSVDSALAEDLRIALYPAKLCVFAQGFQVLEAAAQANGWDLDYARIAKIWRAGCILRASLLNDLAEALADTAHAVRGILENGAFRACFSESAAAWRNTICRAVGHGVPVPAFSSALTWYDSIRAGMLPANLLQALRDAFGAHRFERMDRPAGEMFHVNWLTPER